MIAQMLKKEHPVNKTDTYAYIGLDNGAITPLARCFTNANTEHVDTHKYTGSTS